MLYWSGEERLTQSFVGDKTSHLGIEGTVERRKRGEKLGGGENDKQRHSFTGKHDLLRERTEGEEGRWKKKSTKNERLEEDEHRAS